MNFFKAEDFIVLKDEEAKRLVAWTANTKAELLIDLLRRGLDFAGHAEDVPQKEVAAKQWADEVRAVIR